MDLHGELILDQQSVGQSVQSAGVVFGPSHGPGWGEVRQSPSRAALELRDAA